MEILLFTHTTANVHLNICFKTQSYTAAVVHLTFLLDLSHMAPFSKTYSDEANSSAGCKHRPTRSCSTRASPHTGAALQAQSPESQSQDVGQKLTLQSNCKKMLIASWVVSSNRCTSAKSRIKPAMPSKHTYNSSNTLCLRKHIYWELHQTCYALEKHI